MELKCGVKVKEAYFKAVADLTWEEYIADLKQSCKSKINFEAFDLFIEVDPAEFVVRQEQYHGDNIRPTKRKAERFKVVHVVTKGDDEQTNRISKDSSTKS